MNGWRVHLDATSDVFVRGLTRLAVYRELPDGRVEVIRPLEDRIERTIVDGNREGEIPLLLLPSDALEALRDALDAHLGPRVDSAVADELRSSLEYERDRSERVVDRVLDVLFERGES